MPLGNVIGSPSLKNELISRWENQEANRWGKNTSRVAGAVDEADRCDMHIATIGRPETSTSPDVINRASQRRGQDSR